MRLSTAVIIVALVTSATATTSSAQTNDYDQLGEQYQENAEHLRRLLSEAEQLEGSRDRGRLARSEQANLLLSIGDVLKPATFQIRWMGDLIKYEATTEDFVQGCLLFLQTTENTESRMVEALSLMSDEGGREIAEDAVEPWRSTMGLVNAVCQSNGNTDDE